MLKICKISILYKYILLCYTFRHDCFLFFVVLKEHKLATIFTKNIVRVRKLS